MGEVNSPRPRKYTEWGTFFGLPVVFLVSRAVFLDTSFVDKIIEINVKRSFTESEVNGLIPLVLKLTEGAQSEVNRLMNRLDHTLPPQRVQSKVDSEIEQQINFIIDRWESKISKLGGNPKGLWLVDFDFGDGYYCWKFPENEIKFYHGYQDGFSGRKPIKQ